MMSLWFAEEVGMKNLIDSRYRMLATRLAAKNRSVGQSMLAQYKCKVCQK